MSPNKVGTRPSRRLPATVRIAVRMQPTRSLYCSHKQNAQIGHGSIVECLPNNSKELANDSALGLVNNAEDMAQDSEEELQQM